MSSIKRMNLRQSGYLAELYCQDLRGLNVVSVNSQLSNFHIIMTFVVCDFFLQVHKS